MTTCNRRQWLAALGCLGLAKSTTAQQQPRTPKSHFGLQSNSYGIRFRQEKGFDNPLTFAAHGKERRFASVQHRLGVKSDQDLAAFRNAIQKLDITLEGVVSPPWEEKDAERFEAELRCARQANIDILRMAMLGGRRYETFHSTEEVRQFQTRAWNALQRAAAIAERQKVKLAVENHKDYRAQEFVDLLRKLNSENVGICLDTGNNIALLEDPWYVVDILAPLTLTVHLKDMAVEESSDGFLLAEVPLGSGFLDLPRIVERVQKANPRARFQLEMMTRDPLRIPCLTEDYWKSLAEVPGIDLARTLQLVKRHAKPAGSLPRISRLDAKEQVAREELHVIQSRDWAERNLFG